VAFEVVEYAQLAPHICDDPSSMAGRSVWTRRCGWAERGDSRAGAL